MNAGEYIDRLKRRLQEDGAEIARLRRKIALLEMQLEELKGRDK